MALKHARTPDVFFDDEQRTSKRTRYVINEDSSSDESEVELVVKPQHSSLRREYIDVSAEDEISDNAESIDVKRNAQIDEDGGAEPNGTSNCMRQFVHPYSTTGGKTTNLTRIQELIDQDLDTETEYGERNMKSEDIEEPDSDYDLPEYDFESLPMASSPPILRPGQIWGSLDSEDERRRGRADGPCGAWGSENGETISYGRDWGLEADRKFKLQMQYAKGSAFAGTREATKARWMLYKGRYRGDPNEEVSDEIEREQGYDSQGDFGEADDDDYEPDGGDTAKKNKDSNGSRSPRIRPPQKYEERISPAETIAAEFPLKYTFFPQSTRKQGYSRVWNGSDAGLTEDEESARTLNHDIDSDIDEGGAEDLDVSSKFEWDSNNEDDIPEPENDHDSDADFGDSESDASNDTDAEEQVSSRRIRGTDRTRASARRSVDGVGVEAEVSDDEPATKRAVKRKARESYLEDSSEDERPRKMLKDLAGKEQRAEKIPVAQPESSKTKELQAPMISRQTAASISGDNATKTGVVVDTGETQPVSSRPILKPTSRRNKRVIESASEDSDEQTSAPSQQELTLKRSAARPHRTMSPTKPATTQLEIISEERSRYIVIGGPFQAPRAIGKRQISTEVIGEWERKKAAGLD